MEGWQQSEISKFLAEYGAVPPPWVISPDEHPYSICWRMGAGESHVIVWSAWWNGQNYDEAQRIAYFQKWPPPPCWLEWMIDAIWDLRPWESGDDFDYTQYFARVESLGFGSREDFESDMNDPKWLVR